MNNIRFQKDDDGGIYLSQEDLLGIMSERLARFPDELKQLKKPQPTKIVGLDGNPGTKPSDPVEVARHEGMQTMLEGIIGIVGTTN